MYLQRLCSLKRDRRWEGNGSRNDGIVVMEDFVILPLILPVTNWGYDLLWFFFSFLFNYIKIYIYNNGVDSGAQIDKLKHTFWTPKQIFCLSKSRKTETRIEKKGESSTIHGISPMSCTCVESVVAILALFFCLCFINHPWFSGIQVAF